MNNIISPKFKKTIRLFEDYENYLLAHSDYIQELDNAGIVDFLRHPSGEYWDELLAQCFKKEYWYLFEKGKYFVGAPLKLYIDTYKNRLAKFYLQNVDGNEITYITNQYKELDNYQTFPYLPEKLQNSIKISIQRTKEFIIDRAEELGYKIVRNETDSETSYSYEKLNISLQNEVEELESIDESANCKIIYLNELGIIDFLKEKSKQSKGFSTNGIAKVLSAITGENAGTLQSALNPIGNATVAQKNNPYNKIENVEKVKLKLIEFGF